MNEFTSYAYGISLPARTTQNVDSASKWARALAVAGFALSALFVLLGATGTLWADSFCYYNRITQSHDPMSADFSLFITAAFLAVAVIYFFPSYYLWEASGRVRSAFRRGDDACVNQTNGVLKGLLLFMGLLMFISIGLIAAMCVGMVSAL